MSSRALLVLLALALPLIAADQPPAPPTPQQLHETAVEAAKAAGVQTRLPNASGEAEATARRQRGGWGFGSGGVSIPVPAAVMNVVFWVFVAVAAIAVAAALASMFSEPMEARLKPSYTRAGTAALEDDPVPADPNGLLARADQLAAAGDFAAAMHCVLLAAMAILGRAVQHKSADSLTSWDLLRRGGFAPAQFGPLRSLVVSVERAWFGGRPADAADYQRARGDFDAFLTAGGSAA